MSKPKMTFEEGVRVSWRREMEIGNPWRIIRLSVSILFYGAIHYLYVVPMRAFFGSLRK